MQKSAIVNTNITMKHLLYISLTINILTSCNNIPVTINNELVGKTLPSFNLLLMDSLTKINTKDISDNEPVILLFISPVCPFCKAQTEQIIDNIKSVTHIQFYIISSYPFNQLKQFYEQFNLKSFSNIKVALDYDLSLTRYHKIKSVPYIAIYNKDKILKKALLGRVSTNLITKIASQ